MHVDYTHKHVFSYFMFGFEYMNENFHWMSQMTENKVNLQFNQK